MTANLYIDEPALPDAAAIAVLSWLPTEPVQETNAIRMIGTCGDGTAMRAAPGAARATHKGSIGFAIVP